MSDVASSAPPGEGRGILLAGSAYVIWGFVPAYWRILSEVPPFELTVHRVLWCAVFVAGVTAWRGRLGDIKAIFRTREVFRLLLLTSVLITANWTLYIYCVATNQLVEASLGYYITPLISIALGVVFLDERLSRMRLIGLVLAAIAVVIKAIGLGHIPWIAPTLALSFGFYGYFRKRTPVDSLDGLTVETWILFPFTLGLVAFWAHAGTGAFPSSHLGEDALLIFAGPLTAIPLAMFAAGARRVRMSTLGFLQYIAPSITLVLATFGFGERFTVVDAVTFACVWTALAIVASESHVSRFRMRLLAGK